MKEIIQRMSKDELGLHTKIIEPYKVVRMTTLPAILLEMLKRDVAQKKFKLVKKITVNGHRIAIFRRPE